MNDNARKWLAAARSGKYEQTFGQLKDSDGHMCFLGLGCEVHAIENGIDWEHDDGGYAYLGCDQSLPAEVQAWLGVQDHLGGLVMDGKETSLSNLNDFVCLTLLEIADIVESEPFRLFVHEGQKC